MRRSFYWRAFGLAFLVGAAAVLGPAAVSRVWTSRTAEATHAPLEVQALADGLTVAGQIRLADLNDLRNRGTRRIIDLRPDGEVPGQPTSAQVRAEAERLGMSFAYVPVPQGDMPEEVADRLAAALAEGEGPALLYCRSGRRAARAWALAEASRAGGLGPADIQERVRSVGQSTDDIVDRIETRFAARSVSRPASN